MKKKEKRPFHALCPHCGLTLEVHEKYPFRFYLENDTCPHCKEKYLIKANSICSIMNIIMALIFLVVMESKMICLAILILVFLFLGFSRKLKQQLIYYKYFNFIKK